MVDVYSRRILANRTAITREPVNELATLNQAYRRSGKPGIVNTDQESQLAGKEFAEAVLDNEMKRCVDGRGV